MTCTISRQIGTTLRYSIIGLVLTTVAPTGIFAQDAHSHTTTAQQPEAAAEDQTGAETLLKVVRQATERYKDVAAAEAAGYHLTFGCVSGDDYGAMGLHYLNGDILNSANSGVLDPTRPQIIIYEPTPDGGKRITGADFLVFADAWNAKHSGAPELMGQYFHLFTAPNRFGLPAFYTLHVWAWKPNPKGPFSNWHSNVSCGPYAAPRP